MEDAEEYKGSLRRAFAGPNGADYITVDGWCSPYIRECSAWALKQGLIRHDPRTSDANSDSQYTALCYRLTEKGRKELGV